MMESENINVLNKIYDILNDEFKKKNVEIYKREFNRAIFYGDVFSYDERYLSYKINHIATISKTDIDSIIYAFNSQCRLSEKQYFGELFKKINKEELDGFKASCKARLINACYCDIVDLNNFSLEEIIVILLCYYIEQIREPIEIEEKIICEGRDQEFERMEESISNNNFAIVCGYTKTGKTEFVEKYLQDNDYMMLYYDYSCDDYNSYDKIINNILKDNYVVEFLESIGRISELDFSKRIKLLKESNQACKKAIVIDNFRDSIGGENNEANKYFKLSEEYDVVFILINDVADDQWQKKESGHKKEVYLSNFMSDESIKKIFYAINPQYDGITEIVSEIAKNINTHPYIMREIAEYYKHQYSIDKDKAIEALDEINKILKIEINNLSLDSVYRSSKDNSQIKFSGHLKKIYDEILGNCDKHFLLLITFLNKIVIDVGYVMDWTGAKMELVNKFLDSGWLRVYKSDEYPNRQLICVNFPSSILSIYFSGVKINEKWVSDAICSFMDTISHKLNFEAMAFIKKETFYSIIKTVHDFCKLQFDEIIKMRNKAKNRQKVYKIKEKVKNSFLIFHINSVRYCYKMNMVNEGIALIDATDKYYAELNFRNHDFFINQIKEFEQKYDMLYGWYLVHFATYCSGDLETFSKNELLIYQWFLKDWIECVWQNVVFQYSNMLKGIYYQQWFDLQMIGEYIVIYREIMAYIQKSKALSAEFEELNKQNDVLYELLCISISKFDNTDLICIKDELKIPLLYINKKLRQQYVLSIDDINPYTFCFFARAASIILIWLRKPADYITKSYFQNFLNSIIYGYYSKFIMVERYIYPAISQEIRTEMRNISESGLLIKDFYSTED